MSEPDFRYKKTFTNGRYTLFDMKKRKWYLFDRDGNCIATQRKLAWIEEKNREIK